MPVNYDLFGWIVLEALVVANAHDLETTLPEVRIVVHACKAENILLLH